MKISIALATYNGSQYIRDLLDSLFSQSLLPDEIVVVDDCSSDDTLTILKEYAVKYEIIRIYSNESNLGVNKNFEKAVSLCSGNFILLCDQDDVWLPNNVEMKINALKKYPSTSPCFVGSFSIIVNNEKKKILSFERKKDSNNPFEILPISYQGTTLAMNRALVEQLNHWPLKFKDYPYDCYIRNVAFLTGNMYSIALPLMLYRYHEKNVDLKIRKKHFFSPWVIFRSYCFTKSHFCQMIETLNHLEEENVIKERLEVFLYIRNHCFANNQIKFLKMLFLPGFSWLQKVRLFISSLIYFVRNEKR